MSAGVIGGRRMLNRAEIEDNRRRANARSRALIRLAREHAERYAQLYREELESSS